MQKQALKIRLSFTGAIMIIALFLTHSYLSISALIAALLHELGHIVAARICKIELGELRLGIFGASLCSRPMLCSYKKEIALGIAGPLVNLILALVALPLCNDSSEFLNLFVSSSLFLGILNLLPIYEFDGGRILFVIVEAIRRKPIPPEKEGIIHFVGLVLLFGLMIFATWNDIIRLIGG